MTTQACRNPTGTSDVVVTATVRKVNTMRYMVFVKMAEDVGDAPVELQEAMGREMADAFASGLMVDAGGLYPPAQSTEIRVTAGDIS